MGIKRGYLFVNESFWNLFEGKGKKQQEFIEPKVRELSETVSNNSVFTRKLAMLLQSQESNRNAVYGIEIRANGGGRSSRIPLARVSKDSWSIWKFVKNLKDVDKGVAELENLIYYLKHSLGERQYPLPTKILIIGSNEIEYGEGSEFNEYIKRKVEESGVILFSLDFIQSILSGDAKLEIDKLLNNEGTIFTKNPI